MDEIAQDQIAFYNANVNLAEEWYYRRGPHDKGTAERQAWQSELATAADRLAVLGSLGNTLDIACGTGLWSRNLVRQAQHVTAVDASHEMIEVCRSRLGKWAISFLEHDIFSFKPVARYDTIFFAFWLSHVPPERFTDFWSSVAGWLAPGGQVLCVEPVYNAQATRHARCDHNSVLSREAADGRQYRTVKVYYHPEVLTTTLRDLDWRVEPLHTGPYLMVLRLIWAG